MPDPFKMLNKVNMCNQCIIIFPNKKEYLEHLNTLHKEKKRHITCDLCQKSFLHVYNLNAHKRLEHVVNTVELKCDQCEVSLPNIQKMRLHLYRSHKLEKKVLCNHCDMRFSTTGLLETHNKRKHLKEKTVPCLICSKMFFSIYDVKTHNINIHNKIKLFKCQICSAAFKRVTAYYQHQDVHKVTKDYKCDICESMFKDRNSASTCKTKHLTQGTYKCLVEGCHKVLTNKPAYKSHISRMHIRNKVRIRCVICDKDFASNSDLKRHKYYIHEERERDIQCPQCPTLWKSRKTMLRHKIVHNGKPHPCPFEGCGVVRRTQYSINWHFKENHGVVKRKISLEVQQARKERRIQCPQCDFKIKAGKCPDFNLKLHMKVHKKEKSYMCPVEECSLKIMYSQNSNEHGYNIPSQYYQHLEKIHSITMITHTIEVKFNCKIFKDVVTVKSGSPDDYKNFWHGNAQKWCNFLTRHLFDNHPNKTISKEEFKLSWELYYDRTEVTLLERLKDTKEELDDILKSWKCKICNFVPPEKLIITMARHYIMQHFREAIEYYLKEYFLGDKCQKCVGSLRFGKHVHIGYIHQELLPLLNQDSVELSQFLYPLKKEKKSFVCDECGKVFLKKQHHATHIFSHTGIRPFQCSQCQKSYYYCSPNLPV